MTERTPKFAKKYNVICVQWIAPFNSRRHDGTNLFSLSLINLHVYFLYVYFLAVQVIGPQKELNTSV